MVQENDKLMIEAIRYFYGRVLPMPFSWRTELDGIAAGLEEGLTSKVGAEEQLAVLLVDVRSEMAVSARTPQWALDGREKFIEFATDEILEFANQHNVSIERLVERANSHESSPKHNR